MRENVKTGLRWGLYFAIAYSVYAIVIAVARGGEPFREHGVSLWGVLAAYWGGGILGGLVAGALLPLANRPAGSMFIGFVVAIPVIGMMGMAMLPVREWATVLPVVTVGVAVLIGPLCGFGLWYMNRR